MSLNQEGLSLSFPSYRRHAPHTNATQRRIPNHQAIARDQFLLAFAIGRVRIFPQLLKFVNSRAYSDYLNVLNFTD
jgi:hypothetical protein